VASTTTASSPWASTGPTSGPTSRTAATLRNTPIPATPALTRCGPTPPWSISPLTTGAWSPSTTWRRPSSPPPAARATTSTTPRAATSTAPAWAPAASWATAPSSPMTCLCWWARRTTSPSRPTTPPFARVVLSSGSTITGPLTALPPTRCPIT